MDSINASTYPDSSCLSLDGTWRIQHYRPGEMRAVDVSAPGLDDRYWITASVPGDVHTALIQRRLIPHPYYGHQDQLSRWIEQEEWWYRTTFDYELSDDITERHELTFEGLDTFATVYVNGHEVGQAANMHRRYTFDISRVVRSGWNSVAVHFDPLHPHHQEKELFDWSSYTKERPWLRKAAMNFGWDWGPRIVTTGIWGSVNIQRHRIARLDQVYAYTCSADPHEAVLDVQAAVSIVSPLRYTSYNEHRHGLSGPQTASPLRAEVMLLDREGTEIVREQTGIQAVHGRPDTWTVQLHIPQPRLWWTHDLGEPYLYNLRVLLYAGDELVDRYEHEIGLRTIELQLEGEQGEPLFAFVLNGVRIYAKGANWIPVDNLIGSAEDSRYVELIELAAEAHMNMLRVWAGGIYEKDIFYEQCDRQGILVWQDFAFANALFPDFNRDFMENIRAEVRDNVQRLRNHASLALWCGNNEIDWLYDMKTAAGDIRSPFYGEAIYHELIPDVLAEQDPYRPYWPSSPYGGSDVNDPDAGDRHNWQVWHGSVYPRQYGDKPLLDYSIEGVSFHHYKQDLALFSSEFGMHAAANRYTLSRYIPEESFYWGSEEMDYRNKDTNHRKGILLMEGYTGIPQNIDQYLDYSMLTQAEGLKYGIEHYRRLKHRNSGSLIWQLNDSWPGTSWAIIDYELLPKAAYFYARSFYHPLLLSLDHEPGQDLKLWIVNDTLQSFTTQMEMKVMTWTGEPVYSRTFTVDVPANGAVDVQRISEAEILAAAGQQSVSPEQETTLSAGESFAGGKDGLEAHEVFVVLSADHPDIPDNRYYLRSPQQLNLPAADWSLQVDEQQQTVTLTGGSVLARMVKLEISQGRLRFSDNYFDLLPGEKKVIHIRHAGGEAIRWETLQISALNH
ncbi:beta-mannosidase [Paenibacillus wulumuqiensis]|uniref:beta-mannosidase n=1 Tax=Paenibacillus wulumuqiensis TaxID=1567107 RepID=UPI000619B50E|nr:glycoside hydrolase family 2 protein [Paenibacillus wulumuqiensis]